MADNRDQGGKAAAASNYGDVSPAEVEKFIGGADFPTDKNGLIEQAKSKDAPQEVLDIMDRFPEGEYGSVTDVAKAYGEVKR